MYQLTEGNVVIDVENGIIVSQDDASYQDWLSSGGVPLPIPTRYVFGKKGDSGWYLGVNALDDSWVQMQSERPEGDYIASETGEWVIPAPTTAERLVALVGAYNAEVDTYAISMSKALLNDGTTMESKYASIRSLNTARKTKYLADKAAILAGG